MELSICVPVYNSETILDAFVATIKKDINFVDKFELILVNDSSTDGSWNKIVELKQKYDFIKGVNLSKNFTQHNAVMAALNETSGDVIITMDDDLQHRPSDIEALYNQIIQQDFDVCYTKFTNRKHHQWKRLGSKFNDLVANFLIKKPKELYLSPFRAMSRKVRDEIVKYDGPYPYVDGLILSVTNNITYIEVEHDSRLIGEGNYTLLKSIALWTKMATGFSITPLRVATYLGGIVSFGAFLLLCLFIIQKLVYDAMPDGWTTIIALILFFGGLQLLSIGIIGEYVGRIYLNLNNKAQFIVRDKTE